MTLKTVTHGEEKVIPNGVPVDHSTETRGKSSKSSSVILRKTGEAEATINPSRKALRFHIVSFGLRTASFHLLAMFVQPERAQKYDKKTLSRPVDHCNLLAATTVERRVM